MRRVFVLIAYLLSIAFITHRASAQQDSCLALFEDLPGFSWIIDEHGWSHNPHHLKVDTCASDSGYYFFGANANTGGDYRHIAFTKEGFSAEFHFYVLSDTEGSLGDTVNHNWRDIDSSYNDLRASFSAIENRFGKFVLSKLNYSDLDTTSFTRREWNITFNDYVFEDSAMAYLDRLPDLDSELGARCYAWLVYWAAKREVAQSPIRVWPNPCSSVLYLSGADNLQSVEIVDALGRPQTFRFTSGGGGMTADVSKLKPGAYYLRLNGKANKILIE